jgi:hypothetical protein
VQFFSRILTPAVAATLVLAPTARAATPEQAFAQLKNLAGTWQQDGVDALKYEVISGGSAVAEYMDDMVTVYHLDHDRLLMTHYCSAGNQPRLELAADATKPQELDFRFLDITNLEPGSGYISGATFTLVDANTLTEVWTYTDADGSTSDETFHFTRKP